MEHISYYARTSARRSHGTPKSRQGPPIETGLQHIGCHNISVIGNHNISVIGNHNTSVIGYHNISLLVIMIYQLLHRMSYCSTAAIIKRVMAAYLLLLETLASHVNGEHSSTDDCSGRR